MRVQWVDDPRRIDADSWNALLATQATPTPFIRHAYLAALHDSGSAVPGTGWAPRFLLLWDAAELAAACPPHQSISARASAVRAAASRASRRAPGTGVNGTATSALG